MPDILPPATLLEAGRDGALYARSPIRLGPYPNKITERLEHWAAQAPERTFLARRDAAGAWQHLTYAAALTRTRALAQSLIDRRLSPDRPLVILSGNSLEHLQLTLGCFDAGVPILPISTAYSLMSKDHNRIRRIAELCSPGMVFADDAGPYGSALEALRENVAIQCVARGELGAGGIWSMDR